MIQAIISDELQKSQYFSIIVDEKKDISKIEQISVVIRYFLNGVIYERFMGYRAAESLCAKSLHVYIKEIIANGDIDVMKCVSQTYDGASVMSERLNGVQALFREEVPQAIYVHCYNHRLNLIISDVYKNVTNVKIGIVENVYIFVSGSSVQYAKFVKIQKDMKYKSIIELKIVCFTRWTAQYITMALNDAEIENFLRGDMSDIEDLNDDEDDLNEEQIITQHIVEITEFIDLNNAEMDNLERGQCLLDGEISLTQDLLNQSDNTEEANVEKENEQLPANWVTGSWENQRYSFNSMMSAPPV
ncbi:PREDICTED: uncharacterized protein LOC107169544 [Diuraphis noxia]|uniref:uncharacterized protein LOC107169544 n=1 Tax=Diuraphis noxia TaxID=143948 RepID=UPI000763568D|nr:PREDICTED: uncharacterized protein LOC107169544 [Diuraphis noxia]